MRADGQLTFNHSYAMVDPVLKGYGIAYVPENLVERHIASGKLLLLLDEWSPPFEGTTSTTRPGVKTRLRSR